MLVLFIGFRPGDNRLFFRNSMAKSAGSLSGELRSIPYGVMQIDL